MAESGNILNEVNRLFAEWKRLQPISREDEDRLWKKFRLEWNYNSNHIEGNTLTYEETELLLIFDKTTGDHEMREFEEMKAHDVAIHAIRQWASENDRELTESDIRDLNRIILVRPFWQEAITPDGQPTRRLITVGEYKEYPNSVRLRTGEIFHYAKPEEVSIKMQELLDWYRANKNLSVVVLAAELHYRFILIHPFDDGNGRVARLLMNYVLMKHGFPPVIIKSVDKANYLTALNKADVGDRGAFHEYIATQLIWSLDIAIKAGKRDGIDEEDDIDREIELLARQAHVSKINIRRDRAIIKDLYENSLRDFFVSLEKKLCPFDKLFVESRRKATVKHEIPQFSNLQGLEYIEKQLMYDFASEKLALIMGSPRFQEPDIYEIDIMFIWKGYKAAGMNVFDVSYAVKVQFGDFKYSIALVRAGIENLPFIEKIYGHPLIDEEIKKFINQVANYILKDIKTKAKEV